MTDEVELWRQRDADYTTKISKLVARTWDDNDPEITTTTRAAAQALGMPAAEVWRILEVWTACAGQDAARRRLTRLHAEGAAS